MTHLRNKLMQLHDAAISAKGILIFALSLWLHFSLASAGNTSGTKAIVFEQRSFPLLKLEVDYTPADAKWVEDVAARTDAARRALNRIMPDALLAQLRVVIAPTKEVFLEIVGGWAEHSAAVALRTPPVPTVVINAEALRTVTPLEFSRTLLHELVHCYLGLRLKKPLPRWFEEGVAVIASGEAELEDSADVALAVLFNRTIPLREITQHFPSNAERQRLAYRQSASVVRFLMNEQGASLATLLAPFLAPDGERRISELWNPLYVEPLEYRWRRSLLSWQSWVVALSRSGLFWLLVVALTFLAWVVRKRRSAAQRREWEEEEERLYAALDEEEAKEPQVEEDDDAPRPPWYG